MTREAIKKLLIVAGLALLAVISVILPLHAASSSRPARPQHTVQVTLKLASTPPTTVTAGQNLTMTATISNGAAISITNVNLAFDLPPKITSDNQPPSWDSIPTDTTTTTLLSLLIPEQISGTRWFTARLEYHIMTETVNHNITASHSIKIVAPPLEPTAAPSLSPTSTEIPPTDTPTQKSTPAATETPPASPPTPTTPPPTATPFDPIASLLEHKMWVGGGCLLLLLLILILVLVLLVGRRGKRRLDTVSLPPPIAAGAYLESAGAPDGPRRFDLNPEGITIGRAAENSLVITQDFPGWETVSRQHARVYEQAGRWIVEDMDSMNGVYVNGSRTGHNLLRDGWRLDIGGVKFIFHAGTGEARQ
ncbi:MAG: FHA domain-containing protein [Chloroflexota bacterium]|nr:FHA domain-containing protein [Chloroflexota bacterium]